MKIASIKTVALNEGLEANIKIVDGKRTYYLARNTVRTLYKMDRILREDLFNARLFFQKVFEGLREKYRVSILIIYYDYHIDGFDAIFGRYDLTDKRDFKKLIDDCIFICERVV